MASGKYDASHSEGADYSSKKGYAKASYRAKESNRDDSEHMKIGGTPNVKMGHMNAGQDGNSPQRVQKGPLSHGHTLKGGRSPEAKGPANDGHTTSGLDKAMISLANKKHPVKRMGY
jgi:hypothetical protein